MIAKSKLLLNRNHEELLFLSGNPHPNDVQVEDEETTEIPL